MSAKLRKDPQVILCDVCAEEDRKPARKTCTKCEISMCTRHLQLHLTTPVFVQTHPLTEPMASGDGGLGGTTKCPQHGKLLEYYCLDDMTCVCVSCAIEDQHRQHDMKTFSTAHKELIGKLNAQQQALQVKTAETVSLEKWEKSEREKLGRSSVRLIEAVTNLRDIALTSVQSSVSARMVSIKTSKSSMQAAQKEKDTFRFLQMFSQVHQDVEKAKAADLRKGLEPGSDRDKLLQEIRQNGEKMVEHAGQFVESLLTLVDPENQQELSAASSDLIFEPQILGPGISLSENKRRVFYSRWLGESSAQVFPIRTMDPASNIQGWVVSISKYCDWTIGLCDHNYTKGAIDGNVYGLCCKDNQLSSVTTMYEEVTRGSRALGRGRGMRARLTCERRQRVYRQPINPEDENTTKQMARPQKVEVVWSYPSSLSFFSIINQHQKRKIVTIMIDSDSYRLNPFVSLEGKDPRQSSNRLNPFQRNRLSAEQQFQKPWRCSCGKYYDETSDAYTSGASVYHKSSQATCSCGGVIGVPHITEVLCELL